MRHMMTKTTEMFVLAAIALVTTVAAQTMQPSAPESESAAKQLQPSGVHNDPVAVPQKNSPVLGRWQVYRPDGKLLRGNHVDILPSGRFEVEGDRVWSGTYTFTDTENTKIRVVCNNSVVLLLTYDAASDTLIQNDNCAYRRVPAPGQPGRSTPNTGAALQASPGQPAPAVQRKPSTQKATIPRGQRPVPEDAVEFNGHHYMLYTDTTKWQSAQFRCIQRGGHLVVINDANENHFVYRMMKHQARVWIGLSKSLNSWRWVSTPQSEFYNWAPGEPNSGKGARSSRIGVGVAVCIYGQWQDHEGRYNITTRSKWDDRFGDSSEVTGYICEWDY